MANPNDGTTLEPSRDAGGDTISNEDQPVGTQRGDGILPLTDYKLPRSKIAVGTYDQDLGDAAHWSAPLPVESKQERQMIELMQIAQNDQNLGARLTSHQFERSIFTDRRGQLYRGGINR
jgi:hypothetical protein